MKQDGRIYSVNVFSIMVIFAFVNHFHNMNSDA